jgi:5-methylcytosine-specific restriction protein A
MPAPRVTIEDLQRGVERYVKGDRPWNHTPWLVDWYIIFDGELYPLKYTYALSANCPPTDFNTNQMKSAMKGLGVSFYSLKEHAKHQNTFAEQVSNSLNDPASRKRRLRKANKKPTARYIVSIVFDRNPDVVAEVLSRAGGSCESCGAEAPFTRASNGTPYLEVHHKQPLADGGDDSVPNAEALCPNCHREKHYG